MIVEWHERKWKINWGRKREDDLFDLGVTDCVYTNENQILKAEKEGENFIVINSSLYVKSKIEEDENVQD